MLDASDWLDSDEELTSAFEVERKTTAVNWPVRASDVPLTPGTWQLRWASARQEGGTEPDDSVDVTVITKDDPDPTTGVITVRLLWADGVAQKPGRTEAVAAAVDLWREEWSSVGLEIAATEHTTALDPTMPFTSGGDYELQLATDEIADPGDLVVVLGDTMVYKPGVFGTSGGTPGSPASTAYRFVAIALDMFIEPSGAVSADSQRLLTDTLEHEVSHYMGLPHAVASTWDRFDALADTPRCTSEAQCESLLGDNLMFPYGVCSGPCGPRQLTAEQQGVLQRYVGTR